MKNKILTIFCLTYNHEKYIRKTLEGFVNQKTTFDYNIIIHDDASTDKTQEIINEFVKKYPRKFIIIFQKENQYSKGVDITNKFILPMINSKYIAICEGDDYWCDENKIQLQIEYMESNPNCSLCVHNTLFINENGTSLQKTFNDIGKSTKISVEELIMKNICQTSSYLYKSEFKYLPENFQVPGVGDSPLRLWLALHGEVYYIDKVMSCYRIGGANSWSMSIKRDKDRQVKHNLHMINFYNNVNQYTNYKFCEVIQIKIAMYKYNNIQIKKQYWKIFLNKFYLILFIKQFIPQFIKDIIKPFYSNNGK